MRPPPEPGAQLALLAVLAVLALAAGASGQACPMQCDCAESTSFDLTCRRAQGEGRVWLEGARTQYLNIHCLQKDNENFTCDDIPEFDFGRNGTLEGLSFHNCPLASLSIACVARRVRARAVLNLTVYYPPGGPQLLRGNVEGLNGVRRLFLKGRDEIDEEVTIPGEALALLPRLERLTIQSAWVQLTPGALTDLHELTRLEISMARLRELPAGSIADLPALTELSLFRNEIENITQDTFQNLTSLKVLDVSSNQLSALEGAALAAGCPHLREIYAYNNPLLTMLPLGPLQLLEKLEIFDCDLEKSLNLTSRALGGLPRLTHVTLRSCHIRKLPEDLLTGSTSLRSLNLGDNSLRELPANLFADQRALLELDLSENQLETLPQELFWRLAKLEWLNLDKNNLVELPDRFVEGLPLRALSVAHNHLRQLRSSTFAGAGALEHLDLSRNQLANAPAGAEGEYALLGTPSPFNALLRLRTLNLSHNVLSELYEDIPLALVSLRSLDMSHNNISYVTDQDNTLTFLGANVTVDLRDNNISRVDLSPLLWPAHADPEYASRVLLARNPLHCDCRLDALARRLHGFAGPATLPAIEVGDAECANPPALRGRRFVDIDMHDLICELPSNSCVPNCDCVGRSQIIAMDCKARFDSFPQDFKYFPSELKLRFTPSYLSWIPSTVKILELSGLNMTELPTDLNSSAIKHLDLRGNSLTEVPVEILKANITMKLSRNPLACDCWHTEGVKQLQANSALVKDYEEVTCADGFPVQNVNPEQLCRTFMLVAFGVVLALLGLAFIVATVIYLRYSLHLKMFLYSRGWCGCWVREEDLDKDKKFDAFITYSENDKSFVHNILQPCLEGGPQPFKLCIHHRDWIIGEWIPAQIAESVEQSRRTIVVLSRNFLESMWSRLEFRAANMSAVKEKRSRVIVILLEDVANHKELDAELRAYLATNTYLKWGDPWFWEKLRYALPHRAEEARMRKQGGRLAHLMQGGGGGHDKYKGNDSPLDVKFAPNGKILHAAIKASPDQRLASAVKAMPI